MKGKKILAGVLLGIIAAALAAAVILKMAGFFQNPESEALALLAQLPDKITKSYENEFLGMDAFEENSREKGSATSIKLSGIKVNEQALNNISSTVPALENAAALFNTLQGCSCSIDIGSNEQQGIRKVSGTLFKQDARFHAEAYEDGDSYQYVLPDILPGKIITCGKDVVGNVDKTKLRNDFTEFFVSEYEKTKEDISCRKSRETAETYEFKVPSAVLSVWIQDFSDFLQAENELSAVSDYMGARNSQPEDGNEVSALADLAEQLSRESEEYLFCVRGSEGVLTSLSFGAEAEDVAFPAELAVSVSEEKNSSTVKLVYESSHTGGNSRLEVTRRNGKSDVYENEWDIVFQSSRASFAVNTLQVIDSNDHSYYSETGIKWHGTKVADIVMDGYVKDIVEGESVHYILDDITVNAGDKEIITMKAEVQKALLDYKWDKPEGEEVEPEEITDEMKQEMAVNMAGKLLEFDFDQLSLNSIISKVF